MDVTNEAGVGDTRMGLGVAVGDYDNDGYTDIYLNNYGHNVLYFNNGDGTFSERTEQAGVGNGVLVGGGAAFFDKENDGDLDLYVGNYVRFDPATHRVHIHKGLPSYPSPLSFEPEADSLFENNGDGTFSDVSVSSGIRQVAGRSMGLVTFDYDEDGDCDVYVANDTQENHLFENDGRGHFDEVAFLAGLAMDFRGKAQASMGVELCDLERDGNFDLLLTSFSEEFVTHYQNAGGGFFDDNTLRAQALAATFPHVTWGIVGKDFDNNGYLDVLIGAGDLDVNRGVRGGVSSATAYRVPNILLANSNGKLQDVKSDWGNAAKISESTRGLLGADLNGDGWVDVVALNARSVPSILKNESNSQATDRSFLQIDLCGTQSNRDGLGASVKVTQAGLSQSDIKRSGHSYQSDLDAPLHFGLRTDSQTVQVTVKWPSGLISQQVAKPGSHILIQERRSTL